MIIKKDVMIPMRDGVHIAADIYLPEKVKVDLVIGEDGIRSQIRRKFINDCERVSAYAHAYRAVVDGLEKFGFAKDEDTFRVYVAGDVMVYLLPLAHRDQISFDITVKSQDTSWIPAVTNKEILKL